MSKRITAFCLSILLCTSLFGCNTVSEPEVNHQDEIIDDNQEDIEIENVKVAAGTTHSMAIKSDGSLWVWGENTFGQLGNGKTTKHNGIIAITENDRTIWISNITENNDLYVPTKLMDNITDIAAGDGFSLAVNTKKELFSWGYNCNGELGDGTYINSSIPKKILDYVIFIDAYRSTAIAITEDNSLWKWGDKWFTSPTKIADNVKKAIIVSGFTPGTKSGTIIILDNDNSVYGVGDTEPILTDIKDIASGGQTAYALNFKGELYGWGIGDIGIDSTEFFIYPPQLISNDVKKICSGGMYIKHDDSLWIWGALEHRHFDRSIETNEYGAILTTDLGYLAYYGKKPVLILENIITAYKNNHCMAVDKDGNLYTWGNNQFGQLGSGKVSIIGMEDVRQTDDEAEELIFCLIENHQEANPIKVDNMFIK